MVRSGLAIIKPGLWDVPDDFRCRKPEFTEYLGINAAYDQKQKMGQMYWATHEEKTVGYMMLALGHAIKDRQMDLGIDTYGHIPALVIVRLATDERYERRGVGRYMTSYAIDIATKMSLDAGCRVVLANSAPDAVEFYEKVGFRRFMITPSASPGRLGRASSHTGAGVDVEVEGLVQMYLDMGVRGSERMAAGESA